MKYKSKTSLKLLIFGLTLMLSGCSEDLFEEQINQNKNVIARKISMEDIQFKSNDKLKKSVLDLNQIQINSSSRSQYNEIYDFYIDEENGVYLKKDSLESYTFPIYKTETDSTITNIVFNKNKKGEYDVILAEYNILKTDFTDITAQELEQSEVDYTIITGRFRGPELTCIETQEYVMVPIDEGDLTGDFGYEGMWATTGSYCFWSENEAGGNDDNSSSGGDVITGPVDSPSGGGVGGGGPRNFPDTPCGKLHKGTSSEKYKENFKNLNKKDVFDYSYESGFVQKNVNGILSYSYVRAPNSTSLIIPPNSLNFTHVHNNHVVNINGDNYDGTVKILSPADVLGLITTCQNASVSANINPTEAFGVMISDEGIFAITLLEPISLVEIGQLGQSGQLGTKWDTFEKDYLYQSSKILNNQYLDASGRNKALQKMLLKLLKNAGLENKIGLFEAEVYDVDSYEIIWTKKSLNPASPNATPIETPC